MFAGFDGCCDLVKGCCCDNSLTGVFGSGESSVNKWMPERSLIGCGGEQIPTAFGWKLSKSNERKKPCVDRMCTIGITGI